MDIRERADRHDAVWVEMARRVVPALDVIELASLRKRRVVPIQFPKPTEDGDGLVQVSL